MPVRSPARRGRRSSLGPAAAVATVLAVGLAGCAQVEEPAAPPSERVVAYVAARLIPAGKTIRAAQADGSLSTTEVPSDVLADDRLEDPDVIECLVAGRALPAGALLRRSMFVEPADIGLDAGLTDGTTVDPEC